MTSCFRLRILTLAMPPNAQAWNRLCLGHVNSPALKKAKAEGYPEHSSVKRPLSAIPRLQDR